MCGSNPITDVANGVGNVIKGGVEGVFGSAPSAPQLPAYPNLTPEEQQILGQWRNSLSQQNNVIQGVSGQLGQNQNILQMISGLFNSDGTVNQNAVAQLQQQIGQSSKTAIDSGQNTLTGLAGTNQSLSATNQAYQNALQGNMPANKQLEFQQNYNFQNLKQQAAQQGINIQGDNWANATSNSTAGQKLIQNMQQNNNIQNQNYQFGYLGQLGSNMGQLANIGETQASTGMGLSTYGTQIPLNYLGQSITSGMGSLSPFLTQYQQNMGNIYSPYYMQQIGPYQQQMAQAQANYTGSMNQFNAYQNQLMGLANLGMQGGMMAMKAFM